MSSQPLFNFSNTLLRKGEEGAATLIPIVSEKQLSPAAMDSDTGLGWRTYLATVGVSAAIVSYSAAGPSAGRCTFLIGFDEAKSNARLTDSLMAYAEDAWKKGGDRSFWPFRTMNGESNWNSSSVAASPEDVGACGETLRRFDHAAVLCTGGGGASFNALFFRHDNYSAFTTSDQLLLSNILPLLMKSAEVHVAARNSERRVALLEAMFDKVSMATFLVDYTGRPLFSNNAGQAMLDNKSLLMRAADGTIICNDPVYTTKIRAAFRTAATASDPNEPEIVLRLNARDGDWRLAFVVPAIAHIPDRPARCAMLLVHSQQDRDASKPLLNALGLLPSEQRFLASFLRASSLGEAAEHGGVSEETARTYLKRVRAKLGVNRQMELARLIYGLVPPLRQVAAEPIEERVS